MPATRELAVSAVTTVGILAGLSVVFGWGWPVIGDSVRWGAVAVGLVSLVACSASGWAVEEPRSFYRDPWIVAAMLIGTGVLVAGAIALITAGLAWLVLMIAGTALLWLVSTVHHMVRSAGPQQHLAGPTGSH